MYHADKSAKYNNKQVFLLKKRQIKNYKAELSSYIDRVSDLAFQLLDNENTTKYTGNMKEGELGALLENPPNLNGLSLPAFLGSGSDIDKDNQEIIDARYGYLYISRSPEDSTYTLVFHLEKPDEFNPYLDAHKSFKQALPMIIRDNGIATTQLYGISRILSIFKII